LCHKKVTLTSVFRAGIRAYHRPLTERTAA
jgi:hypothetical protein